MYFLQLHPQNDILEISTCNEETQLIGCVGILTMADFQSLYRWGGIHTLYTANNQGQLVTAHLTDFKLPPIMCKTSYKRSLSTSPVNIQIHPEVQCLKLFLGCNYLLLNRCFGCSGASSQRFSYVPSLKLTVRTWKWMVGILVSFSDGQFSGAMLVSGSVTSTVFFFGSPPASQKGEPLRSWLPGRRSFAGR